MNWSVIVSLYSIKIDKWSYAGARFAICKYIWYPVDTTNHQVHYFCCRFRSWHSTYLGFLLSPPLFIYVHCTQCNVCNVFIQKRTTLSPHSNLNRKRGFIIESSFIFMEKLKGKVWRSVVKVRVHSTPRPEPGSVSGSDTCLDTAVWSGHPWLYTLPAADQ